MVKKYYDFSFELKIDGQTYLPKKVSPLFQQDPFPGGHRYACVLSGKRIGTYFDYVPLGRNESVSKDFASRFFLSLSLHWLSITESERVQIEYFLNSVEEIDFDGERLRFSGICSPVIKGLKTEA